MLGMLAQHNQMKDQQTTRFIGKGAHLIGTRAEISEEPLQQIGRAKEWVQRLLKLIERKATFEPVLERFDCLRFAPLPSALKLCQALLGLLARRCLEDRQRLATDRAASL